MEDVIRPADILAGTAATGATIIDNDIAVSDGLADLERIGRHARVFIDGMASGGWQLGGLNVYKASTSQPDTGQSIRDLLADLRATAELAVALALVNRVMPSMPVYFVATPAMVGGGMLVFMVTAGAMVTAALAGMAGWLGGR